MTRFVIPGGGLVHGRWSAEWQPREEDDEEGSFGEEPQFRQWIGGDELPAEAERYHLYVGMASPSSARTLMARKLKRLDDVITVSVVEPELTEQGWMFAGEGDPLTGAKYLHELYTLADPLYTGDVTAPVLWDKKHRRIINNDAADIVRMLDESFGPLADGSVVLYPRALRDEIDALDEDLSTRLDDGVHRAGFAKTQRTYEDAYREVFGMLDDLEELFGDRGFLFDDHVTEADLRLFVTLVRFDPVYYGLFKCNRRRIADYPNLSEYVRRVIGLPGIAETVDIGHIKRGYYSIATLNPSRIVPLGPELPFDTRPDEPASVTSPLAPPRTRRRGLSPQSG